ATTATGDTRPLRGLRTRSGSAPATPRPRSPSDASMSGPRVDVAVGPAVEEFGVVADGEDGGAGPLAVGLDAGDQVGLGGGVEHGGHLVADQVRGLQGEGAGHAGALELAVGDLVGAAGEQ